MAEITQQEFEQRVRNAINQLEETRPALALAIVQNLTSAIKLRVQQTGVNSDGAKFVPYNPVYAKYGRKAKGYQAGYVDFTRTGQMFRSIQPRVTENRLGFTGVEVKSLDPTGQTKLDGQAKKRGNIITPNEREIEAGRIANDARIRNILQQNGLL